MVKSISLFETPVGEGSGTGRLKVAELQNKLCLSEFGSHPMRQARLAEVPGRRQDARSLFFWHPQAKAFRRVLFLR